MLDVGTWPKLDDATAEPEETLEDNPGTPFEDIPEPTIEDIPFVKYKPGPAAEDNPKDNPAPGLVGNPDP